MALTMVSCSEECSDKYRYVFFNKSLGQQKCQMINTTEKCFTISFRRSWSILDLLDFFFFFFNYVKPLNKKGKSRRQCKATRQTQSWLCGVAPLCIWFHLNVTSWLKTEEYGRIWGARKHFKIIRPFAEVSSIVCPEGRSQSSQPWVHIP